MPGTELTRSQQQVRDGFERLIGLAAPVLDLVLAVGERISRIAEPEDPGYYPVRQGGESFLEDYEPLGSRGPGSPVRGRSDSA